MRCFIIQPFSSAYNRRYEDTYKPAIIAAGFEPYRVDHDPAVTIPINSIESEIQNSDICFADISEDNPNVWYELGYAYALKKEVVLICKSARVNYPFDIAHKLVIRYDIESVSDFNSLAKDLTTRLEARKSIIFASKRQLAISNPINHESPLEPYEISLLVTMFVAMDFINGHVSMGSLEHDYKQLGYEKSHYALAKHVLISGDYVTISNYTDSWRGEDYTGISFTEKGIHWININKDKVLLNHNIVAKLKVDRGMMIIFHFNMPPPAWRSFRLR